MSKKIIFQTVGTSINPPQLFFEFPIQPRKLIQLATDIGKFLFIRMRSSDKSDASQGKDLPWLLEDVELTSWIFTDHVLDELFSFYSFLI